MSTALEALSALGCEASLVGYEPETAQEYADRVTIHTGTRPNWTTVKAKRTEMAGRIASPMSFLQFMTLFTNDEQLSIVGAAMTDAPTKLWYDKAVGSQYIALDDPRLADGLQMLVDSSLISAARKTRVLQGLPPEA
jgi:hypothetical protein